MLILHLIFAGLWLGCILTEIAFERILLAGDRAAHLALARVHKWVDLLVETPAFLGVAATGLWLLPAAPPSLALDVKLACAGLAVLANGACVFLVHRRCDAAERADWEEFDRLDHLQHGIGALVLIGVLTSLSVGLYLAF